MTYTMIITKNFGNKKSATVEADGNTKIEAMIHGLAKLGKIDSRNFKHVRHWDVTFEKVEKKA